MRIRLNWLDLAREPVPQQRKFSLFFFVFALIATFAGSAKSALAATPTTTTLAVTAGGSAVTSVNALTVVTLTAAVTDGGVPVTPGQVKFCDATAPYCTDIHLLGTAALTSAGTATLRFRPSIGTHSYKAFFVGTVSNMASNSAAVPLSVTGAYATTTTLNGSNYGQGATTVVGRNPKAPTGTVSLVDTNHSNAVLATTPLSPTVISSWSNSLTAANYPFSFAVGDFNEDGIPDLASVGDGVLDDSITILLGDGTGNFSPTTASPSTDGPPYCVVAGDFNGDGHLDLAVANRPSSGGKISIFLGDGTGNFSSGVDLPEAVFSNLVMAVGDFDQDGNLDLAVIDQTSSSLTIELGDGTGKFNAAPGSYSLGSSPVSLVVGDLNGDGNLDIVVGNQGSSDLTVLLGNGDGTFTAAGAHRPLSASPNSLSLADLNGDGRLDLVAGVNQSVVSASPPVLVLMGNGDGTFQDGAPISANLDGFSGNSVTVGDFNGDGTPDIAVEANFTDSNNDVSVLFGQGDGQFLFTNLFGIPGFYGPWQIFAGDFNGDGLPDLAEIVQGNEIGPNGIDILLTNGPGATASAPYTLAPGTGLHTIVANYSGDSQNAPSASAPVTARATQASSNATLTASTASAPFGTPVQFTIQVSGAGVVPSGNFNVLDGTTFLSGGTLGPDGTSVFTTSVLSVGSHQISVAYNGDLNYLSSTSAAVAVTITAGVAVTSSSTSLSIVAGGSSVNTIAAGTVINLQAAVSSGGTAITLGEVNFCDASASICTDIHLLGSAALTGSGTATFRFRPGIGSHSYKAVFVGTNLAPASTSTTASLSVTGKQETLSSTVKTGNASDYTLTTTVLAAGTSPPAGTVSFVDTTGGGATLASASVTPGTGALTFVNPAAPIQSGPNTAVATADFNGDGFLDLAVPNASTNAVDIFLGQGDGTFIQAVSPATGNLPTVVIVADFNVDGLPDIAVYNDLDSNISIFLGNGDGTFTSLPNTLAIGPCGAYSIAAGDVNNDGIVDLVVSDQCWGPPDSNISIFLGNGSGSFTELLPRFSGTPSNLLLSDINLDGKLDLVEVPALASASIAILLGNGDGTFAAVASPTTQGQLSNGVIGDFNHDGLPDLAILCENSIIPVQNCAGSGSSASAGSEWVAVLLGDGHGGFVQTANNVAVTAYAMYLGDFNQDGIPDLILTTTLSSTPLSILLGDGKGNFSSITPTVPPLANALRVGIGDFNGDGVPDAVVAATALVGTQTLGKLQVFLDYPQSGIAVASGVSPIGSGLHQVVATYSGNSNFDESSAAPVALTAKPVKPTVVVTLSPSSAAFGSTVILTATVTGSAAIPTGNVTFAATGSLLGTSALNSNGVATFTSNQLAVGFHSITASYAGDSNYESSNSSPVTLTITNAAPEIQFTSSSATIAFGDPLTLTATLTGSGSKPSGSITFNSPAGSLGMAPLDSNGVGTLALASTTLPIGQVSLTATYSGDSNYSAVTSTAIPLVVTKANAAFVLTPSATTITYGSTETLTATASGGGSSHTGTVTFSYGNVTLGTSALNNSVATFATNALPGGSDSLMASWAGDADHGSASSSPVTIQVAPLLVVLPSATTVYSGVADSITINFNVGSNSTLPTGTVTLSSSGYNPGPVTLVAGVATISIPANTLPTGNATLVFAYSGDAVYPASSAKLTVAVSSDPAPGFTIAVPALSIAAGATTGNSSTVSLTPITGFTGNVALAAAVTSSPSGAIDPPTVSFGTGSTVAITGTAAATATLTITTTAPKTTTSSNHRQWFATGGAVLACLALVGFPGRRGGRSFRNAAGRVLGLALMLASIVVGVSSCGGSSSGGGTGPHTTPGTTPGNYTITITGTAGSVTETGTLTLTVG